MTDPASNEQRMPTREEIRKSIANEFNLEWRALGGWMLSSLYDIDPVIDALISARLELAQAKKEREKELREAWEDGRDYGRAQPKDGYPNSPRANMEFAAFLSHKQTEGDKP